MGTCTPQIRRYLTAGLLSALVSWSTVPAIREVDDATEPGDESFDEMEGVLRVLWSGRPEQKREVVEEVYGRFDSLQEAKGEDKLARHAVEWLQTILRTEADEWILNRLLQNLLPITNAALNPLYLDALKSSSPNERWRAFQWFGEQQDPEALPLLESLWRSEERPWARGDLTGALAKNGSLEHLDDFRKMAAGDDPYLASAAIQALSDLHDEAATTVLARLVKEGAEPIRSQAVRALSTWPESPEAWEAVLEASHSDDLEVRRGAISALRQFGSDLASGRILEMAEPGNESGTRDVAVQALGELRPPGLSSVLVEILREAPSGDTFSLQSEAIWILHLLDDPSVLPRLRDLDPNLGGSGFDNLAGLIANLSRDRERYPEGSSWIRSRCGGSLRRRLRYESGRFAIVPPEGFRSVRCWEFPGVAGDPKDLERLQAGDVVRIDDHFEWGKESWVQVNGAEVDDCWVLLNQLQETSEREPKGFIDTTDAFRREFDISFEDLHTEAATSLEDLGLLVVIEPGEEVVGVALSLYPDEIDSIPGLVESYRDDGSILDDQVLALLNTLRRTLPEDPVLGSFFAAHPEVKDEGDDVVLDKADDIMD